MPGILHHDSRLIFTSEILLNINSIRIPRWRPVLFVYIPIKILLLLVPFLIIFILNTLLILLRHIGWLLIVWKIISNLLVLRFCIYWPKMLKLALFMCCCLLFLMHFKFLNYWRMLLCMLFPSFRPSLRLNSAIIICTRWVFDCSESIWYL